MEQDILDHLERIGNVCDGLTRHPAWTDQERTAGFDRLATFDQQHWTFTRYLSLPLYEETSSLLHQEGLVIPSPPCIAVVMAVYRPDPELLRQAISSAIQQVGVRVHLHLSLDGPEGNLDLVEAILAELDLDPKQLSILTHPSNRGVGLCRNAALLEMREKWFTFLDCDDIFHPLRLLHAWLAMQSLEVIWLNTACSRVSLRQGKIFLAGDSLSATGFNSFLAAREVLDTYGYLAPLRYWEDSEYQQRLVHFGARSMNCAAVGHYANTELEPSSDSLGQRWRREAYPVEAHPYLCGTLLGGLDPETVALRDHFHALYQRLDRSELPTAFPADDNASQLAPS